jgi:pimeloyl-ACP methyl ester carboxylesterase
MSNDTRHDIYFERNGEGPPAILVHGNPATHTFWRPVVGPLSMHRTLHTVDLPGFGHSPAPASVSEYAVERIAEKILAFADREGLERFDLVGHSFGGAVAATIAAAVPGRIKTLTLITPVTPEAPPLGRLASSTKVSTTLCALWRQAPGVVRRGIAARGSRLNYGPAYTTERASEIAHEIDRKDILASMCALMSNLDYSRLAESYRRLEENSSFPLMLVGAGADRVIPFGQFLHLRARLPRARCTIYPDCSHVPVWQRPEEVAELVAGFWGGRLNHQGTRTPRIP